MKRTKVIGLGLLVCCVGIQSQASIVYEGFDYSSGSTISAVTGTGTGWDGNWSASTTGSGIQAVTTAGLTFSGVGGTGKAVQRSAKNGLSVMNRTVASGTSLESLTADGSTMWFSVLMNSGGGNTLNTWGTLMFGDTALSAGSGTTASIIGANGNGVGVSFAGTGAIQGVTYSDGTLTEGEQTLTLTAGTTAMIVGKVDWAEDGFNDTISLYNVTDTEASLPTAFSTMTADLDQTAFNVVGSGGGQISIFDEIRFDTELANVIPEPATLGLFSVFGAGFLFVRRRFRR